jgi:hypothetical protein
MYDREIFEHNGNRFMCRIESDDAQGPPWDSEDGHGPVSDWTTRAKRPGEITLVVDHPHKRYYDFQEAVKIAKRDGWDAEPYSDTETSGQRAAKAAMADYNRMRQWCSDYWGYVGLIVCLVDDDDDPIDDTNASLWGIESDAGDYLDEAARELADECAANLIPAKMRA